MRPRALVNSAMPASATEIAPTVEGPGDETLVRAAQQGCNDAFSMLVDRHHRRVYSVVYHLCGPDDADDLTQDVFLRALGGLRDFQYQGEASFRTWLTRIASNTAINELRRRRRRSLRIGPSLDARYETASGPMEFEVADDGPPPSESIERAETIALVRKALQALAPKHRAALVLVDIEGLDYAEAALTLGCPVGTLKSRIARARKAFAKQYLRLSGAGSVSVCYHEYARDNDAV